MKPKVLFELMREAMMRARMMVWGQRDPFLRWCLGDKSRRSE